MLNKYTDEQFKMFLEAHTGEVNLALIKALGWEDDYKEFRAVAQGELVKSFDESTVE